MNTSLFSTDNFDGDMETNIDLSSMKDCFLGVPSWKVWKWVENLKKIQNTKDSTGQQYKNMLCGLLHLKTN